MTYSKRLEILNRAFIRVYRSFGLFLRDADPVFDIGDEREVKQIQLREQADVERIGETLVRENGSLDSGLPRIDFGDVFFLNFSNLLPKWISEQKRLVAGLEIDLAELAPDVDRVSGMVEQVLNHERDHLKRLESIATAKVAA